MFSRIGIIGAGAMGRGIAQLFASAGQQVWLYDTRPEAIEQALQFNRELLERSVGVWAPMSCPRSWRACSPPTNWPNWPAAIC
jgi:3-hydroxyacyl-CoA dehydrogenase